MVRKVEKQKFVDSPKAEDKEDKEDSDIEGLVEETDVKLKVEPKPKVEKTKRKPSKYNLFVKQTMPKLKDTPPKERFARISTLWKKEKAKQEKASKKKK